MAVTETMLCLAHIIPDSLLSFSGRVCVRACVYLCVCVCVHARARVRVSLSFISVNQSEVCTLRALCWLVQ